MKIIILLIFLAGFNGLFSNNPSDIIDSTLQQEVETANEEESRIFYEEGLSWYNMAEYLSAEEAFLKSSALAEKTNQKEILAFSLHYLGNIESWKSEYHQSILYNQKAKTLFSKLGNSEYIAISNNQIAARYTDLGEYDSTLVYYMLNINNREAIEAKYTIFNTYRSMAALYAQLYNYKLAYSYLQEGIEYAEETDTKMSLAKLYFTAGQLFMNNHVNKDNALEYLLQAKSLFEELNNLDYLNWVNLSIGDAHFKTGNDSLAMHYYKEVSKKLNPGNYSTISSVNHLIGMVYKRRKEYDSALFFLQKSIDGMCLVCPEISIHNTLIEAGRTYLITGNSQQAYDYLNRARNIAFKSNTGLEMVISSEELAKYYQNNQQQDSAIFYFNDAYERANELGLLQRIKTTAESLSKIYYSSGAFQTAIDYLTISNQMNDSLAKIEKYNEIARLEMRFEIEKREEDITKQKLIRNTSVTGAIIVIFIGIMLLRAYRSKRRDNNLLAKQKAEIQEISKQLQESSKRKLDFFTNISHEIRTPLTLIKSPLERIIKTDKKDHETNSQLQTALNNTNKLKELVNQILDLEKLDENILGLDLSNFELINFCQGIVTSFEGYCYQSNCHLIFESNASKATVRFDQLRLQSIIHNLLSNAFKYNKEGGLVKFKVEVDSSQVKIEIIDNGIGISAEHLQKLGERYYQVETSNASVEGTGIGLAYVKELVDLMNGIFEISSIVNKGTTVSISLPCDEIEILDETVAKKEIKHKEQLFDQLEEQLSNNSNGLPSILIVEDNFELRMFLRDLFAPSYHVILAKDGQEGHDMALKHIPDLIISDIMMPRIKGNELCKILKNDINTSHITIILFTAKSSPDNIVDGYDCGADDYIVKPFDTDLLVKKVKNIITTGENVRKQFSFTEIERSTSSYSEFDKKFLNDCFSIIKENIDNSQFTVELLAEKMNVHRRTLLRKFNALTDKTPTDLIRHTRMSKAAELLKDNKYRVNEVALMVGYEDTNRFSQAFKQFFGVSPSLYE